MGVEKGIQSLDRGLAVLRLLSRTPSMTATAIAAELGVHQSSASRLLNSLYRAGFVRKPEFHSFALDYGTLVFAGYALDCFPEVSASTQGCNRIHHQYGFNAGVGILRNERVLYLTRVCDDAALTILDNSSFPLHCSTIGLALACERTEKEAVEIIAESIVRHAETHHENVTIKAAKKSAREIYKQAVDNIRSHDFLYKTDLPLSKVNGSATFMLNNEQAALAVYHPVKMASAESVRQMVQEGISCTQAILELSMAAAPKTPAK